MEPYSLCVYQAHGTVAFVADSQAYFILSFQSDVSQQIHTNVDSKLGRIFNAFKRETMDKKGRAAPSTAGSEHQRRNRSRGMSERRGIVCGMMIGYQEPNHDHVGLKCQLPGFSRQVFIFIFCHKQKHTPLCEK